MRDVTTASQQEIRAVLDDRITEKAFQTMVVQLAKLCGWKVYFTWKSVHSPAGFPDLVLVHPVRRITLFVENKTNKGKVSEEQLAWINCLMDAGQRVAVWRPHMWDMIEGLLKGRENENRF